MDISICAAAFTASWSAVSISGFNVVDWLLAAALFFALCARVAQRRTIQVSFWMVAAPLAAFIVETAAVLSQRADDFNRVMVLRVFLATTVIAILVQVFATSNRREMLIRLLGWWGAGIALSAAFAVLVANGMLSLEGVLTQATGYRLSGLAAHPNGLAFSLCIAFPVLIYLVRYAKRFAFRLFWLGALAVSLWALFLSDSRSGLLVGLVSMGVSIVANIGSTRGRLLLIPLLVLAGALAATVLPGLLAGTRLVTGAPMSDAARTLYNSQAIDQFLVSPIVGGGFSALGGVAVPLQVISTGGIIFVLGYYAFLLHPLLPLWRGRTRLISVTGLLVILTLLAFGVFNPIILERAAFWPALIALFYVRSTARTPAEKAPWAAARPRRDRDGVAVSSSSDLRRK
jgi:hypothetical protein